MTNDEKLETQPPGVDLKDIYYVLFRHKRKIILFCLVGVLAAIAVFLVRPPLYESEGRLLVKGVRDNDPRLLDPGAKNSEFRLTDSRGEGIINTEKEILTSFDLALQVADEVGPEKIVRNPARADRV